MHARKADFVRVFPPRTRKLVAVNSHGIYNNIYNKAKTVQVRREDGLVGRLRRRVAAACPQGGASGTPHSRLHAAGGGQACQLAANANPSTRMAAPPGHAAAALRLDVPFS